jgi:hypothetical protein
MAARRKLFLTHAGELAHHLVGAIARDAMAMEFVRGYAEQHDRRKVLANAERLREMEFTISREALLLIAAEVRRLLPRAFGLAANARSEDLAICDLFFTEFLEALGRAMEWPMAEAELGAQAFRRDLEIYARWRERTAEWPGPGKSHKNDSPFPDRCAILLDSAMMEQARRAAAEFQADLLRLGARIFGQLGRSTQRRIAPGGSDRGAPGEARRVVRARTAGRRMRKPAKKSNHPRRAR